ncbi:YfhO family protein, partial [bacterium]|nr:YfhO family protein [bacterium]
ALISKLGWTLFSLILSVLLAAIVLVPLAQLSQHTAGRAGGAAYEFAVSDSMPPSFLAALIAPLAYGDPTASIREAQFWLTRTGYHELCGYTGILALFAAIFAGIPNKKPEANHALSMECLFFALIGGLGLFFALGEYNPLYPILYYGLPGWSYFRVPARLVLIFLIGVSVCSSVGIKRWLEAERDDLMQSIAVKCAAVASLLLCIAYIIVVLSKPAILSMLREYEIDQTIFNMQLWTADRSAISARLPEVLFETRYAYLMSSLSMAALWTLLGWGSLVLIKRTQINLLRYAPVVVLLTDLLLFSSRFVPTTPQPIWRKTYFPDSTITTAISQNAQAGRVLLLDDAVGYPGTEIHPELRPNRLMHYGIHTARGYDPLILRRYARYANQAFGKEPDAPQGGFLFFPTVPSQQFLNEANVCAVVTGQPLKAPLGPVWSNSQSPLKIWKNTGAHEFWLENDPEGAIEIIEKSASSVVLSIQTAKQGRLIWSQVYYPNWSAKVNETPVNIEAFKETWISIPVPEGDNQITIRFNPSGFKTGILITGLSFLFIIVGIRFSTQKQQQKTSLQ